jgi:hypothetical protein
MTSARTSHLGFHALLALLGAVLLVAVRALSTRIPGSIGDGLTRNTVRLSLAWYTIGLSGMLFFRPEDWSARTRAGRFVRWCWTWGLLCFLTHLAMAFHYFHHWSHAHAFEHTRAVSGVGEGLYISYAFTVLWMADVAAWWLRPQAYAARSPWIDRLLHAFMLFMVFNGTIVYESGAIRWAGIVLFTLLAMLAAVAWRRRLPRLAAPTEASTSTL